MNRQNSGAMDGNNLDYYNGDYYYYLNQQQNNSNTNYVNPYQQQYYSNYYPYRPQNNVYQNYGEYANTNYNMQNNLQQNYNNNYTHQQQLQNTNANIPIHNENLDKLVYETYAQLEKTFLKDDEEVKIKDPIDIGDKKIYAISDMEGDNEKLFELLKHIGVIKECSDNEEHDGELILSTNKQRKYKLDDKGIKNFKKTGILVLVGDFVSNRESDEIARSLLNLIFKLNCKLNPQKPDALKQSMFLVLGNHDVKCYDGEGGTDEEEYYLNNGLNNDHDKAANRRGLKEYLIDNFKPYLQVVVKNKKNQHVVFQHTGFPYKREGNRIMNRVVDPKKTKEYLNGTFQGKNISKVIGKDWSNKFKKRGREYIDGLKGFFDVRINCDENGETWFGDIGSKGKRKSDVTEKVLAENSSYDDRGVGYDIKVIGHGKIDSQNGQIGDSNSQTSGNVISVTNESYKTKNGMDDFEVLNKLLLEKGKDFAEVRKLNHMPTDINNFAKVSLNKQGIKLKKNRWGRS